MSTLKDFQSLQPDQVQKLLDSSAQQLRNHYLNVLTLSHDLLARYSSAGNATVFTDIDEINLLLESALREIKALIPDALDPSKIKPRIVYIRSYKLDVETTKNKIFLDFSDQEVGKIPVKVFDGAGMVLINGRYYRIDNFQFDDFVEIVNAGPQHIEVARRAYDKFLHEIGAKPSMLFFSSAIYEKNYQEKAKAEEEFRAFKALAKAIEEYARRNISQARTLKGMVERNTGKETIQAIDKFLEQVVDEYQLLRIGDPSGSAPPQTNKPRSRPPISSYKGLSKTLDKLRDS